MIAKIGEGKYTQSTFDDDVYKANMQWAYMMKFPDSRCSFEYKLRSKVQWPTGFGATLQSLFSQYKDLTAPKNAEEYLLKNAPHLPLAAIDYLINFRFNPAELQIFHDERNNELKIKATGPTVSAMRWEIPVLSTVSELYHEMTGNSIDDIDIKTTIDRALEKGSYFQEHNIKHVEFGTRRRHSYKVHEAVTTALSEFEDGAFVGTSNMHLAMKLGLKMIGTTGHEWYQFHAGVYGYQRANYRAIENWSDVYRGRMGIVLPDTFTTASFLKSFDTFYGNLYTGARQDSGDWKKWTDMFVARYKELEINPSTKQFVYSDGIKGFELCQEIKNYCDSLNLPSSLGLGTWLTCDVPEVNPLNQVMKMTSMNLSRLSDEWQDVIKLGDGVGKETGNPNEIQLAKTIFKIPTQTPELV